ncbi:class I SAM-dependent methyltransferase [Poriferisphaera sp. WC338]|uniref:class I SAM-dependent methyltransferase n=1 Tax=Poriferisphaera sp. WC338 TaxID=3425129 RepID=UPI003D815A1F
MIAKNPENWDGDIHVNMGDVQTTMLLPLWARAVEMHKDRPVIRDEASERILKALDFDFSMFDNARYSQVIMAARHTMFDEFVLRYLAEHPDGVIIELGCGLSTRYDRLDNGKVRWFDVDLPDAIEMRKRFFEDSERNKMIACSMLEEAWIHEVKAQSRWEGPYLMICEGVTMYFDEREVRGLMQMLADEFSGGWFAFDSMSPLMVKMQKHHELLKYLTAKFKWAPRDIYVVEEWDNRLHVIESLTLKSLPREIFEQLPLKHRLKERFISPIVGPYRVNLVCLQEAKVPEA